MKVNCAALPLELLESELFGYERGAFTGAHRQKPGKFELANTGTIFLDEIGEMPMPVQAKLLQVLQDREFSRLGSQSDIRVDVRVIAATNKDLARLVQHGHFREDLYYRLNVLNIHVPPLRERQEEIPVLVEYFLDVYSREYGRPRQEVSAETMQLFMDHGWRGNVRELENIIKRIVALGNETQVVQELTHRPLDALEPSLTLESAPATAVAEAATAAGAWRPALGRESRPSRDRPPRRPRGGGNGPEGSPRPGALASGRGGAPPEGQLQDIAAQDAGVRAGELSPTQEARRR